MSILSNSNYEQTVHAISRLRQMIEQQSNQEIKKYEMIAIKTKIIEEQILQSQQTLQKHQSQCTRKMDQFAMETKQKLKELKERSNDKEIENDLAKEMKELQGCRQKISKMIKSQYEISSEKLQNEVNNLQQSFDYKVKLEKESFAATQKSLKEQLSKLKQKIKKNEFASKSQQILVGLEEMKANIDLQMGELRAKRKEKKQKFLELLQAIIVKCKQTHESKH